ncbi:DUF934 domain-containing protein [uncultured Litoreibacter sp.]|uniref:DUF934 domain-containing protein n=1 Tax=uncultured Litoreibacter sp. TaxID=1392394 RepID=UPI00261CDFFB|nr:DUF934 domain-containing protein [uncultured Litoreibacter sp.]
MSVLVQDTGFVIDDWDRGFTPLAELPANDTVCCIDLPSDADPAGLANRLSTTDMIRIDFPSSADGRGFTIARRLRLMGYEGRLRAHGHVIADQYAMARRSGFDEVEIPGDLAARQPQDQWLARANWKAHDYQNRLRA